MEEGALSDIRAKIANMLNLQTKSLVLRNQVKKDKIDFKNDKQEALYNRFIQETPFYAKKHKAVLARPQ